MKILSRTTFSKSQKRHQRVRSGKPYLAGKGTPKYRDFEHYAGERGLGFLSFAEPALDRQPGATVKQIKRHAKNTWERGKDWQDKRNALRDEYAKKLSEGKIVEMSRFERLKDTANSNPDNEATQAARRVLEKQGITWRI
jgi:hypothetical protein